LLQGIAYYAEKEGKHIHDLITPVFEGNAKHYWEG